MLKTVNTHFKCFAISKSRAVWLWCSNCHVKGHTYAEWCAWCWHCVYVLLVHIKNLTLENQDRGSRIEDDFIVCFFTWSSIPDPAFPGNLAVCSLSLHQGSTESWKTLEQNFIFQIGILNPYGINERFHSTNLFFCFSCYQAPTNSVAPSFCIINYTKPTIPRSLEVRK